jgi:hypothetical protein
MVSSYWEVKSLTERQSDLAVRSKPAIKPRAREKVKARTESNSIKQDYRYNNSDDDT